MPNGKQGNVRFHPSAEAQGFPPRKAIIFLAFLGNLTSSKRPALANGRQVRNMF